jgi:hypothetical protein
MILPVRPVDARSLRAWRPSALRYHISGSFGGIAGVYQRYDYMPERRDAILRWERHIQTLVQD